jgi:FdhD protein
LASAALLRAGRDPADGFIVMSSRCSFELVQKAAAVGVGYLATVSAPTALALSLAESCSMRLASGTPDGVIEFATAPQAQTAFATPPDNSHKSRRPNDR